MALGIDILKKYIGLQEVRDNTKIKELLASKAIKEDIAIDPAKTSWCSATVNFCERSVGNPGTGKLTAQSFNDYGTGVDLDSARKGDIIVLHFKTDADWQGHVTYLNSVDPHGNLECLGGNQSNEIKYSWYAPKDVRHIRRPPNA